ncbi:protein IMPACT-B-like [Saccoglossus kowalevskii]
MASCASDDNLSRQILLPECYPSTSPPLLQLGAPWLKNTQRLKITEELDTICSENIGENVIYLLVEKVREFLIYISEDNSVESDKKYDLALISETEDGLQTVNIVLDKLCENKKIANATHNIFAYRIQDGEKNSLLQDCEDDGETAAGGRLLHLLQILEVCNVVVVVSRWYGGILLGPDRFKHINNAARNILQTTGFIENKNNTVKSKKTKHKKATKK